MQCKGYTGMWFINSKRVSIKFVYPPTIIGGHSGSKTTIFHYILCCIWHHDSSTIMCSKVVLASEGLIFYAFMLATSSYSNGTDSQVLLCSCLSLCSFQRSLQGWSFSNSILLIWSDWWVESGSAKWLGPTSASITGKKTRPWNRPNTTTSRNTLKKTTKG